MGTKYVDQTIKIYNAIAEEYAKQAERHAPDKQRRTFLSLLPKKATIVDMGCGSGRETKFFCEHGCSVIGIDLSEKLLAIAKKEAPQATFIKKDIRSITLPNEHVDGIWMCASLLHIKREEAPAVVKRMYAMLRPGGIFFLHLKEGVGDEERIDPSAPGITRHFTLYTKKEVEQLVSNAGFVIVRCFKPKKRKSTHVQWISCFAKKV